MLTPIKAMMDPKLFGRWFAGPSWAAWFTCITALFGLDMTEDQHDGFKLYTGRETPPTKPAREAWLIVGRRGGKSIISALIACFLACFRDYSKLLSPGEAGVLMCLAADRRQARVVIGYIRAFLRDVPMLARMVESETRESIQLTNRIVIEVHTTSYRTVRGYTVVAAILDEIAFWRSDESANPDAEIVAALRPAMATVPGALLLGISSPYARRGVLWQAHRDHFGVEGDPVLVWKAPTLAMNPTIPSHVIETAYEQDPAAASAEWGAQFRQDIESFVSREAVDAVVIPDRHELPRVERTRYWAFCDPSGGSRDSMTLGISHLQEGRAVLDLVRERRAPFSPEAVVEEFAECLRAYGLTSVSGDRYGGEWPRERFKVHGVTYDLSKRTKNEIYGALLPAVNSGRVELLDHKRLVAQLCSLERWTARGGRDSIDHPPGAHDDVANAAAGVLVFALDRAKRAVRPFDTGVGIRHPGVHWNLDGELEEGPLTD